jgi:hypothetical protein
MPAISKKILINRSQVTAFVAVIGALTVSLTYIPAQQSKPKMPASAKLSRVRQVAAAKDRRLPSPIDPNRFGSVAAIIETSRDGSTHNYIYRHVGPQTETWSKKRHAVSRTSFDASIDRRADPFSAILASSREPNPPGSEQRRGSSPALMSLYAEGQPIAAVTAMEQPLPPPPIERIVAILSDPDAPFSINVKTGIDERDQNIIKGAFRSLNSGEAFTLEMLVRRGPSEGRQHRLVAYRIKQGDHVDIYGSDDRGGFQRLSNGELFDHLAREATEAGMERSTLEPGLTTLERKLLHDLPHVAKKLDVMGIPAHVGAQIIKLASDNKINIDDSWSPEQSLEVLFRTDGEDVSEPVAVTFHVNGEQLQFYKYRLTLDRAPEFYDVSGRPVSRFLDKKPVPNGRLGDGFAWRTHPILKTRKHHNGIDYAAPYGSPILAAADGVVSLISYQSGYGKYIRVEHEAGYMTTYAHISGVPSNIKVGQRVSQGQLIAYVGSTGLSTGPHLYYELRKGDQYLDPTRSKLPAGTSLKGEAMSGFHKQVERLNKVIGYLDLQVQPVISGIKDAAKTVGRDL